MTHDEGRDRAGAPHGGNRSSQRHFGRGASKGRGGAWRRPCWSGPRRREWAHARIRARMGNVAVLARGVHVGSGAAQGIGPGRPTARVCAVAPTHVTSSARRKFWSIGGRIHGRQKSAKMISTTPKNKRRAGLASTRSPNPFALIFSHAPGIHVIRRERGRKRRARARTGRSARGETRYRRKIMTLVWDDGPRKTPCCA